MDDLPFDFTRYLSQRFGVSSEQAADLLRSWLKDYEPEDSYRPGGLSTRPRSDGAQSLSG